MAAGCGYIGHWFATVLILDRPKHFQLSEAGFVLGAEDLCCIRLAGLVEGCYGGNYLGTKVPASKVERYFVLQDPVSEHRMALVVGAEALL